MIQCGHLSRYVASEGKERVQPPPPSQPTPVQHQLPLGEIHEISEGFAGGEESSSARKAHLRSIRSGETLEVQTLSKLPRQDTTIIFSDFDMEGCQHPNDNPLVIKTIVANKTIHKVVVDNGSSGRHHLCISFRQNGHWKGEARASQCLPTWFLRRKSNAPGVGTTRGYFGRPLMPDHNNGEIPHSRCPIGLQHVTR